MPFGVNLMRSQVLYWAAQDWCFQHQHKLLLMLWLPKQAPCRELLRTVSTDPWGRHVANKWTKRTDACKNKCMKMKDAWIHKRMKITNGWMNRCLNSQTHENNKWLNEQMHEKNRRVSEQLHATWACSFCSHCKCCLGRIHSCMHEKVSLLIGSGM